MFTDVFQHHNTNHKSRGGAKGVWWWDTPHGLKIMIFLGRFEIFSSPLGRQNIEGSDKIRLKYCTPVPPCVLCGLRKGHSC